MLLVSESAGRPTAAMIPADQGSVLTGWPSVATTRCRCRNGPDPDAAGSASTDRWMFGLAASTVAAGGLGAPDQAERVRGRRGLNAPPLAR